MQTVERPSIDSFMAQRTISKSPSIDDFMNTRGNKSIKEPSIYSKGGIYEQFGPRPRQFNPIEGIEYGMTTPAGRQPGTALPYAGQMTGNMLGSMGGPVASAAGGVVGALTGEGIRQGIGKMYGVQDSKQSMRQFGNVAKNAAIAEGTGLGLYGLGKLIPKPLIKGAEKIMFNYLRPTGKLAKENPDLGMKALKMGVKGGHESALASTEKYIGSKMDELNSIISKYGDRETGLKNAFKYLDEEIAKAKFAQADDQAKALEAMKQSFMDDYLEPVYGKESTQFVMGPSSKQTTPKKSSFSMKKMTRSQKEASGAVGGKGPRVITERASLETPEDVIAMKQTGKRGVAVGPKETYEIRPETKGPETGEFRQIGVRNRPVTVSEAQARKQAQYENLKGRRVGGGYGADTKSTDISGRQAYARGLKDDVVEALSDIPDVPRLNKEVSDAMKVREALFNRIPVAKRNDIISLSDSVLGGMSYANPKVLSLLAARKLLKNPMASSGLANAMYKQGSRLSLPYSQRYSLKTVSPLVRALLADSLNN